MGLPTYEDNPLSVLVVIHFSIATCPAGAWKYSQKCRTDLKLKVGCLNSSSSVGESMDFFNETQNEKATNTTTAMEENTLVDLILPMTLMGIVETVLF